MAIACSNTEGSEHPHCQKMFKLCWQLKKQEYDRGYPFALEQMVLVCDGGNFPLPDWTMAALAEAAKRKIRGVKVSCRGGRHSNPLVKQDARIKRTLILTAVLEARRNGYVKPAAAVEVAAHILQQLGIEINEETIKKIEKQYRGRIAYSSNDPDAQDLVLSSLIRFKAVAMSAFKDISPDLLPLKKGEKT